MDEGVVFLPHKKFFLEELVDESEQPAPRLVPLVERKFELSVIVERPGSSHDLAGSGVERHDILCRVHRGFILKKAAFVG